MVAFHFFNFIMFRANWANTFLSFVCFSFLLVAECTNV